MTDTKKVTVGGAAGIDADLEAKKIPAGSSVAAEASPGAAGTPENELQTYRARLFLGETALKLAITIRAKDDDDFREQFARATNNSPYEGIGAEWRVEKIVRSTVPVSV